MQTVTPGSWPGSENDWYLFDPLFDRYQCKDKTLISKWYFFDLIDGVCPYYDGIPFQTSITEAGFFTKTAVFCTLKTEFREVRYMAVPCSILALQRVFPTLRFFVILSLPTVPMMDGSMTKNRSGKTR